MLCSDPILAISRINIIFIIYNVYFLKVRADERFCSKRKTKEESMERNTKELLKEPNIVTFFCLFFFSCIF